MNARDVKNVPGRPKTDKLDAVWLAKLNERGMLRPSFVPPAEIRQLRDYTRLRVDLIEERTRYKQRVEKLLEDALIKLSTVATDIFGKSGRAMLEALIAGERDPEVLADLALGRMAPSAPRSIEALTGRFDDHHAELARMLLDQIDALSAKIDTLTARVDELIAEIPAAASDAGGGTGTGAATARTAARLEAVARLDEIPGIGAHAAQVIIAEIGLDMAQFPTAGHLVSWAKLSPAHHPVRAEEPLGQDRQGQPLPEAASSARPPPRRPRPTPSSASATGGSSSAAASSKPSSRSHAPSSSIVWHLLADPTARFHDLGADYYASRITSNETRNLVHQLEALGHRHPHPGRLTAGHRSRGTPRIPGHHLPGSAAAPSWGYFPAELS